MPLAMKVSKAVVMEVAQTAIEFGEPLGHELFDDLM